MKSISLGLALFAAAGIAAFGQEKPTAEIGMNLSTLTFYPGSGVSSFTAVGGSGTAVFNVTKMFSAVADLGAYHNTGVANFSPTTFTYLFGPRVSLRRSRFVPYVQALFGGARVTGSFVDPNTDLTGARNSFASAFGGGLDVKISDHVAIKPFQLEYLMTRVPNIWSPDQTQNNLRYSAGVVFRLGAK